MQYAEKSASRPLAVTIACEIFIFNSVLLLLWWLFLPEQIVSNGSQVFFMTMWLMMATLLFIGVGWVRYASLGLLLLFVLAWYNTGAGSTDNIATSIAKGLSFVATALLFIPPSHKWYRWIYKTELAEERNVETDHNPVAQ